MSLGTLKQKRELEDEKIHLEREISNNKITLDRHLNMKNKVFYQTLIKKQLARLNIVNLFLIELGE